MKTAIIFKSLFDIGDHVKRLDGHFEEATTGRCTSTLTDIVVEKVELEWDNPKDLNAFELYYSHYCQTINFVSLPHHIYTVQADYGSNSRGTFVFSDAEIDYDL